MTWPWSGIGSSQPASDLLLPDITHTLSSWVGDLSDYLLRLSLSEQRNQMLSGSLQLLHYDANGLVTVPTPFHPEGGEMALDAHNMSTDRTLTLTVVTAGQPYIYPTLLPGDPSVDSDGVVTLPVTDMTPLLMVEGQNRRDIIADVGDVVYAHDEMKAIGAAYGVTVVCRGFPNFPIRELRMSDGTPLGWLDQIAAVYRAVRRWVGSTLVYEVRTAGAERFRLEDRFRLETGTFSMNSSGLKNSWISNRLQPTPGQLAYSKREGRETLGFVGGEAGIQFMTGATYAIVLATVVNGSVEFGVFYDKDGHELAQGIIYVGSTPAVSWRAQYVPSLPWPDTTLLPGWEVRVLGTAVGANRRLFPIDDEFTATLQAAELVARYGLRPEYRSLDMAIVPTAAVNADVLAAIRRETELSLKRSSWGTPWYNPLQRPGTTVGITDFEHMQSEADWLVDSGQVEMREPGDWYQTLGCLKAA